MQAVLLAAGRGSRMGSRTASTPKALVPVSGDVSVLEFNVRNMQSSGVVSDLMLVAGYCHEKIEAFCAERSDSLPLRAIVNDRYATTGPAQSLRLALDALPDDVPEVMIGNGDTLFSARLISDLAAVEDGIALAISHENQVAADDIAVGLDADGTITQAEKAGSRTGHSLVSAGLVVARGPAALQALRTAVLQVCEREIAGGRQLAWHHVFSALAASGAPARPLPIARDEWWEFDTDDCIARFAEPASSSRAGTS